MNLLIVEDEAESARPLLDALRADGHNAVLATGVEAARFYLARDKPAWDVLICDWRLQDGTALEILEGAPQDVRTVVHSGVDRTAELQRAARTVDYILVKSERSVSNLLRVCREIAETGRLRSGRS